MKSMMVSGGRPSRKSARRARRAVKNLLEKLASGNDDEGEEGEEETGDDGGESEGEEAGGTEGEVSGGEGDDEDIPSGGEGRPSRKRTRQDESDDGGKKPRRSRRDRSPSRSSSSSEGEEEVEKPRRQYTIPTNRAFFSATDLEILEEEFKKNKSPKMKRRNELVVLLNKASPADPPKTPKQLRVSK